MKVDGNDPGGRPPISGPGTRKTVTPHPGFVSSTIQQIGNSRLQGSEILGALFFIHQRDPHFAKPFFKKIITAVASHLQKEDNPWAFHALCILQTIDPSLADQLYSSICLVSSPHWLTDIITYQPWDETNAQKFINKNPMLLGTTVDGGNPCSSITFHSTLFEILKYLPAKIRQLWLKQVKSLFSTGGNIKNNHYAKLENMLSFFPDHEAFDMLYHARQTIFKFAQTHTDYYYMSCEQAFNALLNIPVRDFEFLPLYPQLKQMLTYFQKYLEQKGGYYHDSVNLSEICAEVLFRFADWVPADELDQLKNLLPVLPLNSQIFIAGLLAKREGRSLKAYLDISLPLTFPPYHTDERDKIIKEAVSLTKVTGDFPVEAVRFFRENLRDVLMDHTAPDFVNILTKHLFTSPEETLKCLEIAVSLLELPRDRISIYYDQLSLLIENIPEAFVRSLTPALLEMFALPPRGKSLLAAIDFKTTVINRVLKTYSKKEALALLDQLLEKTHDLFSLGMVLLERFNLEPKESIEICRLIHGQLPDNHLARFFFDELALRMEQPSRYNAYKWRFIRVFPPCSEEMKKALNLLYDNYIEVKSYLAGKSDYPKVFSGVRLLFLTQFFKKEETSRQDVFIKQHAKVFFDQLMLFFYANSHEERIAIADNLDQRFPSLGITFIEDKTAQLRPDVRGWLSIFLEMSSALQLAEYLSSLLELLRGKDTPLEALLIESSKINYPYKELRISFGFGGRVITLIIQPIPKIVKKPIFSPPEEQAYAVSVSKQQKPTFPSLDPVEASNLAAIMGPVYYAPASAKENPDVLASLIKGSLEEGFKPGIDAQWIRNVYPPSALSAGQKKILTALLESSIVIFQPQTLEFLKEYL